MKEKILFVMWKYSIWRCWWGENVVCTLYFLIKFYITRNQCVRRIRQFYQKWHILRRIFYNILTYIAYNLLPYWKYVHTYQNSDKNILGTNFFKARTRVFTNFTLYWRMCLKCCHCRQILLSMIAQIKSLCCPDNTNTKSIHNKWPISR